MKNTAHLNYLHRARERRLRTIFLIIAISTILVAFTFGEPVDVVAYTLYTEARGESFEGKKAVASVIQNAAKQKGRSLEAECLKPYRYEGMKQVRKTGNVPQWFVDGQIGAFPDRVAHAQCYYLAKILINGHFEPTSGANMFFSGAKRPYWFKHLASVETIGGHTFGYLENL